MAQEKAEPRWDVWVDIFVRTFFWVGLNKEDNWKWTF